MDYVSNTIRYGMAQGTTARSCLEKEEIFK